MSVKRVFENEASAVFSADPLVVVVCTLGMPLETVKAIELEIETLSGYERGRPDADIKPIGLMIVMQGQTKPPEPDVRTYINDWTRNDGGKIFENAGLSVVIERDGLWGSTLRVVAKTIQLGNRATYPTEIFGTVEEAARFHAELVNLDVGKFTELLQGERAGAA